MSHTKYLNEIGPIPELVCHFVMLRSDKKSQRGWLFKSKWCLAYVCLFSGIACVIRRVMRRDPILVFFQVCMIACQAEGCILGVYVCVRVYCSFWCVCVCVCVCVIISDLPMVLG